MIREFAPAFSYLPISREFSKVAEDEGSSISTESISLVEDRASDAMKLETPGIYAAALRRAACGVEKLWRRMRI